MNLAALPTAQGADDEFQWSAAVLLTGPRGWYLVRRNPKLAFFPGYWALAGGKLDPLADGPGPPDPRWERSLRVCALRELEEEVGVLPESLARSMGAERDGLRAELLAGGEREHVAGQRFRLHVDAAPDCLDALRSITWATTPRFAPRRYRALYFELELPAGEEPEVVDGELVEGAWFEPADLLASWRRGGVLLVPPVVALLEALERAEGGWGAARDAAHAYSFAVDRGALHVVSPTPGIAMAPVRTATIPPATTTNCYVVGHERAYVVDPACTDPGETARLVDYLEEAHGPRLVGVLVTHHHPDHTGAVDAVARRFGLPVHAHPLTLARLPVPARTPVELDGGEVLDLGTAPDGSKGWNLAVHHTPGHDRGHLCFVESHARAIVAGDLVSTLSTIVIDPPEGHLRTYLASLERMNALDLGVLLPSHGPAAPDGNAVLAAYLRHRSARESKLARQLAAAGPVALDDLVDLVYDDAPPGLRRLALRSLLAGLEKLAEDGRAERAADDMWAAVDAEPTQSNDQPIQR
jgi:endoribonuclease LACTB2